MEETPLPRVPDVCRMTSAELRTYSERWFKRLPGHPGIEIYRDEGSRTCFLRFKLWDPLKWDWSEKVYSPKSDHPELTFNPAPSTREGLLELIRVGREAQRCLNLNIPRLVRQERPLFGGRT